MGVTEVYNVYTINKDGFDIQVDVITDIDLKEAHLRVSVWVNSVQLALECSESWPESEEPAPAEEWLATEEWLIACAVKKAKENLVELCEFANRQQGSIEA